ncbi:MAG: homoserine kinase [Deltaproteobacteria bacterium]|nr:homoserine kinase [Deltaproteobacteria bacterium]
MSGPRSVRVFAPATVANVAAGFDILGFAVGEPGDEVTARLAEQPGVRILRIEGDGGALPLEAERNTAGVAAREVLALAGRRGGIELEVRKRMPSGSGLGSSAASGVAAAVAVNALLGGPLRPEELLPALLEAERVACGTAHADNVAPALLGGFVLVRSYRPLDVVRLPTPAELWCALAHPQLEIRTADARRILRDRVRLSDAVVQWGNTAGLVAGLLLGDYALIGRSLQDVIVEPVRAVLIPGFARIKEAALDAGALGCSISGSGPSVFALARGAAAARAAGDAMASAVRGFGLPCDVWVSPLGGRGAHVVGAEDPS